MGDRCKFWSEVTKDQKFVCFHNVSSAAEQRALLETIWSSEITFDVKETPHFFIGEGARGEGGEEEEDLGRRQEGEGGGAGQVGIKNTKAEGGSSVYKMCQLMSVLVCSSAIS